MVTLTKTKKRDGGFIRNLALILLVISVFLCSAIWYLSEPVLAGETQKDTELDPSTRVDQPLQSEHVDPPLQSKNGDPLLNESTSVERRTSVEQKDFYTIAVKTKTDKVAGVLHFDGCVKEGKTCIMKNAANKKCRPWGHFYHTMYDKWLGPMSTESTEPFQFLEIGFYIGRGYDAFQEFLPKAEAHSMEKLCTVKFAKENPNYDELVKSDRLHCGDASNYTFLDEVWRTKMNRPDAPPLKVVVDDGSHHAAHMAKTLFFWFPKIEPRGILVVEDIEPLREANEFRTQVLPQVMKDLHYCGDPSFADELCFPTIQPLLASVHCEMHICVFERNDEPAVLNMTLEELAPPANALEAEHCFSKKAK